MGTVYGNKISTSGGEGGWRALVEYSTNSATLKIQVIRDTSLSSLYLNCTCYIDGVSVGTFYNEATSVGTHTVGSKSISADSSHSFSATCTGGGWGQNGTSSGTIPVQVTTGTVNVDPKINGTTYASGKDGFTFNMSGMVTETNKKDYYNDSASPGSYTATPNAKVGYTTTADSGSVSVGNRLDLYPKWDSVQTTITLNSDGATTHGTTTVTGKYDQAMPTITPPTRSNADFLGYFAQPQGQGTQYYKADGTSNTNWDGTTGVATTLYAGWDFHDFLRVSQNGGTYDFAQVYVSQNGGAYTLVDASMVKISQNGGNYTPIM